jgi:hypothetical protein
MKHPARLLNSLIGHSKHHVKNSTEFIHALQTLRVGPQDIMVSFNMVSLFTNVPILSCHFTQDIVTVFKDMLTSTYFVCNGQCYEQTDGIAIGSPLSPIIANFNMEDSEKRVLEKATHKPLRWYHYVDDTFVTWQHGVNKLETLELLNSMHKKIQFTMGMEDKAHLPFLDTDMYTEKTGRHHRPQDVRIPMHTNLYLRPMSHHHLSNKYMVLATLMFRARTICDKDSLGQELEFLETSFRENGYSLKQIQWVFSRKENNPKDNTKPNSTSFLPHAQLVSGCLNRMLSKHNLRGISIPPKKVCD